MMRVAPCEEPRSCPGSYCSMPSARTPRTARRCSAALPITPSPLQTTGNRAIFMPRFRSAPLTAPLPRYCERTCCGSARPYGKRLPPVIAGFTFGLSQPMRLIMLGVLVWLAWGLDLVAAATVPLPRPRPLPVEAPEPTQPSGTAAPSGPAAPAGPSQCFAALTSGLADAEALPPIAAAAGCGADDVVRLHAGILKDAPPAEFKPPPTLRGSMAAAVANWLRDDVATQVLPLGAPLAGIENYDSYECRPRNRVAGAEISEHGRANQIDIRSFTLTKRKR